MIKQIVCMFFSVNSPVFRLAQPALVQFVLNRDLNGLDPKIKIFAYYSTGPAARHMGVAASLNIFTRTIRVLSEIAFPPFGYLMALGSTPPDERLVDISFLAKYRYNDWKDVALRLPVLPVYTMYPGDYRNREAVLKEAAEDRRASSD